MDTSIYDDKRTGRSSTDPILYSEIATKEGYLVAGYCEELYEDAEVFIFPIMVASYVGSEIIRGRILKVHRKALLGLDSRIYFVIELPDGTQTPMDVGFQRQVHFKIQKIPGGDSPENTPGEVIEF